MAREPALLYVLTVLAEVENADERFIAATTGLSLGEVRDAVERLKSAGFATAGRNGDYTYANLTNLGRSVFKAYWKQLKRCQG